ncbi:MAG: 6-bladed beta-propeller [Bacteroidales bacterium]|nr:6-bladed beta-propeller [Bacteroidales bacterium]
MKYMFLLIAALLLCTCKGRQDSPVTTIDVLSPAGTEIKNLSEIASDIRYIPLETNPDALMVFIRSLKTSSDRFYLNAVREILCFENQVNSYISLILRGGGQVNTHISLIMMSSLKKTS